MKRGALLLGITVLGASGGCPEEVPPSPAPLEVTLPRARASAAGRHELLIVITRGRRVLIDGVEVPRSRLERVLREKRRAQPRVGLVFRADPAVPHGEVVSLMDLARRSGFQRFSLAVNPRQPRVKKRHP